MVVELLGNVRTVILDRAHATCSFLEISLVVKPLARIGSDLLAAFPARDALEHALLSLDQQTAVPASRGSFGPAAEVLLRSNALLSASLTCEFGNMEKISSSKIRVLTAVDLPLSR